MQTVFPDQITQKKLLREHTPIIEADQGYSLHQNWPSLIRLGRVDPKNVSHKWTNAHLIIKESVCDFHSKCFKVWSFIYE